MTPNIMTVEGDYFSFVAPAESVITITAVAHALSHICRFTGHCRKFYSVAQHSVLVSRLVPPEHAFAALMHDAHEAYIQDISSPLKMLLPDYKAIEKHVEAAVLGRFGIDPSLPACVKRADLIALATEQRDLMNREGGAWAALAGFEPAPERIRPVGPRHARWMFMRRYRALTGQATLLDRVLDALAVMGGLLVEFWASTPPIEGY